MKAQEGQQWQKWAKPPNPFIVFEHANVWKKKGRKIRGLVPATPSAMALTTKCIVVSLFVTWTIWGRLNFEGVGVWILFLLVVKPGENTEESWVLPSTTDCRTKRLTSWFIWHWCGNTGIKWSGQRLRSLIMKWCLGKSGLIRKRLMFPLSNHLLSRCAHHRSFHYHYELTRPASPQLALLIIAKCGFGFSFNWLEPPRSADGKMTIQ